MESRVPYVQQLSSAARFKRARRRFGHNVEYTRIHNAIIPLLLVVNRHTRAVLMSSTKCSYSSVRCQPISKDEESQVPYILQSSPTTRSKRARRAFDVITEYVSIYEAMTPLMLAVNRHTRAVLVKSSKSSYAAKHLKVKEPRVPYVLIVPHWYITTIELCGAIQVSATDVWRECLMYAHT